MAKVDVNSIFESKSGKATVNKEGWAEAPSQGPRIAILCKNCPDLNNRLNKRLLLWERWVYCFTGYCRKLSENFSFLPPSPGSEMPDFGLGWWVWFTQILWPERFEKQPVGWEFYGSVGNLAFSKISSLYFKTEILLRPLFLQWGIVVWHPTPSAWRVWKLWPFSHIEN